MLPWLLSSASACVFLAEGQAGMAAGWWPCHSPTGMGSILRKAIPSPGTVRGSPGGQQGRAALVVGCIPLGTAVPQFPHIPIPFSLSQIPSRAAVPGRASPRTRRTPSPTRWVRGDAVGTPRGVPAPCCEASGDTVGTHHPALWGTRPIAAQQLTQGFVCGTDTCGRGGVTGLCPSVGAQGEMWVQRASWDPHSCSPLPHADSTDFQESFVTSGVFSVTELIQVSRSECHPRAPSPAPTLPVPPWGAAVPLPMPSSPHSAGGDGHGPKFLPGGAAGPPGLRPEPLQHGHEEDAAQHLLQRVGAAGRRGGDAGTRPGTAVWDGAGTSGPAVCCQAACTVGWVGGAGGSGLLHRHCGTTEPFGYPGTVWVPRHGLGTPAPFGYPGTVWVPQRILGTPIWSWQPNVVLTPTVALASHNSFSALV